MSYDVFVPVVLVLSCIGIGFAVCLVVAFNQIRALRAYVEKICIIAGRRFERNETFIEQGLKSARKQALIDTDNSIKAIAPVIDEKHEIFRETIRAMSNRQDSFEIIQKLQTKDLGALFNKTRNFKAVKVKK